VTTVTRRPAPLNPGYADPATCAHPYVTEYRTGKTFLEVECQECTTRWKSVCTTPQQYLDSDAYHLIKLGELKGCNPSEFFGWREDFTHECEELAEGYCGWYEHEDVYEDGMHKSLVVDCLGYEGQPQHHYEQKHSTPVESLELEFWIQVGAWPPHGSDEKYMRDLIGHYTPRADSNA
jgi:hypothetical protein